jgi:four helix bundle protein
MEEKANQISERFLAYAVEIVKITTLLRKTATGREIAGQLVRSGTSAGANYEESRGAQSRADFLHKLQIVLKELRESLFWLRLIQKSQILRDHELNPIIDETRQLSNIIAKSVVTAKAKQ